MSDFKKSLIICILFIVLFLLCLINFGCTQAIKTPMGWEVRVEEKTIKKPYGLCNPKTKEIVIHPPSWIPQIFSVDAIIAHELGHTYGIERCENHRCLMYENELGLVEYYVKPLQLLYGLRFCPVCLKILEERGALDVE